MDIQNVAEFLEKLKGEGTLMVQHGEGEPRQVEGIRIQHDFDPRTGKNETQVILRAAASKGNGRLAHDKGEAERKVKEPVTK